MMERGARLPDRSDVSSFSPRCSLCTSIAVPLPEDTPLQLLVAMANSQPCDRGHAVL
uniref:Expressed protein n=1 Tax=Schizophyllum commune (strain H4-8 / FGSC 9210) TaxID=578458 RepID=D8QKF2_SCHCM